MTKRIILLIAYALVFMFIGRNLSFVPQIRSDESPEPSQLKEQVEEYIKKQPGNFSVFYKDLETGGTFGVNEHEELTGASLNKVVIISYLYFLAKQKKINLEENIVLRKDDIQDYGTGSLRYQDPGSVYSLKTLAKLALEQSDNTAAYVIANRLGRTNIEAFAKKLQLTSTNMEDNKASAADMGRMFELIYERKITNEPLTLELLDFLKDTDFEDRLARYVHSASIFHKTGDAIGMIHDAGLFIDKKSERRFVLVVLTSDQRDEERAKEEIGKIAQIVYGQNN